MVITMALVPSEITLADLNGNRAANVPSVTLPAGLNGICLEKLPSGFIFL
jgi:hypothetical protein